MPVVVTFAPIFAVPDTLRLVIPLNAPSMSAAPVIVKALPPPASVLWVLMVVPMRVASAPSVMASP